MPEMSTSTQIRNRHLRVPASRLFRLALLAGKVKRGPACQRCGLRRHSGVSIEGHHTDYAKPLSVIWLCRKCHVNVHALSLRGTRGKLAEVLIFWRIEAGRKVVDVAKEMGIAKSTLSRIERGEDCDGKTLAKIIRWQLQ